MLGGMKSEKRICTECGAGLQVTARTHAEYCSARCRVRAHRRRRSETAIPEQMRSADRWMRYRLVPRGDKMTKEPTQINGRCAAHGIAYLVVVR